MATIGSDAGGRKRVLFVDSDGSRKTIRLGKCSKADAAEVKYRVENLLSWRSRGKQPDPDTCEWVDSLTPELRDRFVRVGLVDPPEPIEPEPQSPTLETFLDDFVARNGATKKPATLIVWGQVIDLLKQYLPKGIRLDEITAGHAKQFQEQLKARGLASTTIAKRLGFAKQFMQSAVDWELIDRNPFATVKAKSSGIKSNVEVPREVVDRIFLKCDPTWRVIVALSRFGGLRCPSEVLSLRWEHIDWEHGRMSVPEPKVEHHDGRGVRSVPLFPELLKILSEAYEIAPDGAEFVVDKPGYRAAAMRPGGWASANLRTQFLKILVRAGVAPWERLFHSMRATRQTELERTFPRHVVCAWMGNTAAVADRHYLLVTESDFEQATRQPIATSPPEQGTATGSESSSSAAQKAAHKTPKAAQKAAQHTPANGTHGNEETPENIGETVVSTVFSGVSSMEVNGLEPMTLCLQSRCSPN